MNEREAAVAWLERDYDETMELQRHEWTVDGIPVVRFVVEGARLGAAHTVLQYMFTIKDQNG